MQVATTSLSEKIDQSTVNGLKQNLKGVLLQPQDEGFHQARKIWNGMIDKLPAFIVQPKKSHCT